MFNTQQLGLLIDALGGLSHDVEMKSTVHEGPDKYCRADPEELIVIERFLKKWRDSWHFLTQSLGDVSHFFTKPLTAGPEDDMDKIEIEH